MQELVRGGVSCNKRYRTIYKRTDSYLWLNLRSCAVPILEKTLPVGTNFNAAKVTVETF